MFAFDKPNFRLSGQKLFLDSKKPRNYLAELPAEARGDLSAVAGSAKEEAPSEAANRLWWTQGESDSRLDNANVASCHWTMGPKICFSIKKERASPF